tara:strand:+ start:326 stop:664 length:339 start_codon:yes stop_codon:yes gene_type:complete
MMTINAPIIKEMVPTVMAFYKLVQQANPNKSREEIFQFIQENKTVCNESYEAFETNVEENRKVITKAMKLKNKSNDEIIQELKKMNEVAFPEEEECELANDLLKFTIKDEAP